MALFQCRLSSSPHQLTSDGSLDLDHRLSTGEGLDDGVVPWVRQVLQQVVEGPLAGDVVLDQEAQERQHGQPPCTHAELINNRMINYSRRQRMKLGSEVAGRRPCGHSPLASSFSLASSVGAKLSGLKTLPGYPHSCGGRL